MKDVLIGIAKRLVAAAADRAEQITHKQAALRLRGPENYAANAGGWN